MNLLQPEQLQASPIVANNRMNRERNATGINSYEKDLGLNPIAFLQEKLRQQKDVRWLDICCGKGKALIQTQGYFESEMERLFFTGIDLVGMYDPIPDAASNLELFTGPFENWHSDQTYDLITCVHGIHYMGDKLQALAKAISMLNPNGTFLANFDIRSIKNMQGIDLSGTILSVFNNNRIEYSSRKKIIQTIGGKKLKFPFRFVGADDAAGPNYTGQEAVHSYYEFK
jgi:SAM-dependent methyltransferase